MFHKTRINTAVLSVLAGAVVAGQTGPAMAQNMLEEVVVTATKRAASTQDIPVAVTALTEDTLDDFGVSNFSSYLTQLPGVTAGGAGPGQNTIYIRGVASTTPNLTTAGVAGLVPNVALYLDEQPLAQPGRNLDVYIADINRVEVLAGPQGTLFGASSQAGTVRLITNKPDVTEVYGNVKAGASYTKDGEMSNNVNATLNVPIGDSFAVRGTIFVDNMGGYIDNVAGTRTAQQSARFRSAGTMRDNGVPVEDFRGGFQAGADLSNVKFNVLDNSAMTEDDFNDTTYSGFRVSALWDVNEDWSARVGFMDQSIESDGTFYADPELDDYEIQRFVPEEIQDDFYNVNWTVEGRIGALEVLYTGAFTDRDSEQNIDYTDYLYVGQYIPYYICDYYVSYTSYSPGGVPTGTCQAPDLAVGSKSTSEVTTHEFRLHTPAEERLRLTAGVFYSDLEFTERNSFTYINSQYVDGWGSGKGDGLGFAPNYNFPSPGYHSGAGPYPTGVIFRNDIKRTDEQLGAYAELSFDISDSFDVTGGLRWDDYEVDFEGSANSSFCNMGGSDTNSYGTDINDLYDGDGSFTWLGGCALHEDKTTYTNDSLPDPSDPNYDRIVNSINAPDKGEDDGVIGKLSLSWTPTDDQLWYVTWSEGYRPGLLNRPGGAFQAANSYTVPFDVQSDELTNFELGWKLDMMDGLLRFNGSAFFVEIEGLQTTIFDTSIVNLFFSDNAADAEVKGLEGDLTWLPTSGLMVRAAFSYLDTEVTDVLIPTGDVVKGSELAYAPEFQGNLSARYTWDTAGGLSAHIMPSISYSAASYTDIIRINRIKLDSWTLVGVTAGVTNGTWMVEAFVDNLTDEKAELGGNFVYDKSRVTYARPLNAGVRFSYEF
ncbi:MAG: TonB-dependent receptor [Halieaceae bacterium]|nr:TonB-dependent receptor [Halieaceae bacterium]